MKNTPYIILGLIVLLSAFALFVDLANNTIIHFQTPKLPFFQKPITIYKELSSRPFSFFVGSTHVNPDFSFHQGLDLAGGTSVTLQADMKGIPVAQQSDALQAAKTVIERRTNLYGVSEPVIQTAMVGNNYRILVDLPGVSSDQAVRLIGTTAQLTFWEEGASGSAVASGAALPVGIQGLFQHPHETNLTGNDLQTVAVTFDPSSGQPQVQLAFTSDGTKKFADITTRNSGKVVAIALDNQIIEAPRVNTPIVTGDAVINGSFTQDQAQQLSIQLKAGSLPIPLSILEQHEVGATLGAEYLSKMLLAGFIGILIIVTFMLVLYGGLGMLASFALIIYSLIVVALFKVFGITMTLAGIAGFVLSIGMAVDANILIFERMREELRLGKSKHIAIELGFSRAWTSIRDSNISTLITSFILYQFGNGTVKGFAVTLTIGVIVSMFSAVFVTRTFVRHFYT